MFRNDVQICRAVRVLLDRVNLGHLWSDEGPTRAAVELLRDDGSLSSGQFVMLMVAFGLYNNLNDRFKFTDVLVLDGGNLVALGGLLVALGKGSASVDAWIEAAEPKEAP